MQKYLIKEKKPEKALSKEIKEGSGMADVPENEDDEMIDISENEDFIAKKIESVYEADMWTVLGYLNQYEWIQNINIGNIMQIQPYKMSDLLDI